MYDREALGSVFEFMIQFIQRKCGFFFALIFILSLSLSFTAHAQGQLEGPVKFRERVFILKKILEPFVRSLPRDVTFFHWGKRGKPPEGNDQSIEETIDLPGVNANHGYSGPVPLRPAFQVREQNGATWRRYPLQDYFSFMAGAFFKGYKAKEWLWGPALYASTDPLTSMDYARDPSFLLSIGVKKGTRFLDLRRYDHALPIRSEVVNSQECSRYCNSLFLNQIGPVKSRGENPKTQYWLDILRLREDALVRKNLEAAFKELGVEFMAATWFYAAPLAYAPCRGGDQEYLGDSSSVELIFVEPQSVNHFDLKVFVEALEPTANAEKKSEYRRMHDLMASASFPPEQNVHYVSYLTSWRRAFAGQEVDLEELRSTLMERSKVGNFTSVSGSLWAEIFSQNRKFRQKESEFASQFFGCSKQFPDNDEAIPASLK